MTARLAAVLVAPAGAASGAAPLAGNPALLWYLNRASGLVLLVLLTLALLLGQLATARMPSGLLPRFVTVELHRNISIAALALLVLHVLSSVADGFVDIAASDVFVPLRSPYRPVWLGLGTVALDLLAMVALTTVVRHRIPYRGWRAVHCLSYAAWLLAGLHGLGTGTDTRSRLTILVTFGCITAVMFGLLVRITGLGSVPLGARAVLAVLVVAMPLLTSAWLRSGPMQPDWSRRAGTPPPVTSSGGGR